MAMATRLKVEMLTETPAGRKEEVSTLYLFLFLFKLANFIEIIFFQTSLQIVSYSFNAINKLFYAKEIHNKINVNVTKRIKWSSSSHLNNMDVWRENIPYLYELMPASFSVM